MAEPSSESMIVLSDADFGADPIEEGRPTAQTPSTGRRRGAPRPGLAQRYGVMALAAAVLLGGAGGFVTGRASLTSASPVTDEGIRLVFVTDSSVPSEVVTEDDGLRFRQRLTVVNAGPEPFYLIDVRGRGSGIEISGTTGIQEIKAGLVTYVDLNVALSCDPNALNQAIPVEVQVSTGSADATPTTLHRFVSLFTASLHGWTDPQCGRFIQWPTVGVTG